MTSTKPVWSIVAESIVIVPARSANCSSTVVLVVQPPDFVVERVVLVEIGPVGLSLAETVTVRDVEQVRLLHVWRSIVTGAIVTDRSLPMTIPPPSAQPNSSEIDVNRPFEPIEYLDTWRQGGPAEPSSFAKTESSVSVQTVRPPVAAQVEALLEKFVPPGPVSGRWMRPTRCGARCTS